MMPWESDRLWFGAVWRRASGDACDRFGERLMTEFVLVHIVDFSIVFALLQLECGQGCNIGPVTLLPGASAGAHLIITVTTVHASRDT
jgi:hypothetical protein